MRIHVEFDLYLPEGLDENEVQLRVEDVVDTFKKVENLTWEER